jgi:Ca-activated chloride channel family protein
MSWTLTSPLALLLWPLLVALTWGFWRGRPISRAAWAIRLLILTLLVLTLANPQRLQPETPGESVVLVVDQSASLGDEGIATLRAIVERAQASGNSALRTLLFAERTQVLPLGMPPAATNDLGAEGSTLGAALRLAAEVLPPGGRVVLLSDGGATDQPATQAILDHYLAQNIPLDLWTVPPAASFDVGLTALDVPPVVRRGESYSVNLVATASSASAARLQLWQDNQLLAEQSLQLAPGDNQFTFDGQIPGNAPLGMAGFRAQLVVDDDRQPANDRLTAATTVAPVARLLLVNPGTTPLFMLRMLLEQQGLQVTLLPPDRLPPDPDALAADYDAIWLVDVAGESLTTARMSALQSYVRDLGHGLIVSGGRESLTLGDYANTPLEAALPVRSEPPPRSERRAVSMLIILDHSASMEIRDFFQLDNAAPTKLMMAKQAAALATQNLGPDDRIGVLQFDTESSWVVPFQQVGAGLQTEAIREAINNIAGGGGTNIPDALRIGLEELARQPAGARHAILLTDGRSSEAREGDYLRAVNMAREAGITLSTIAIGQDADIQLLERLAELGQGRYAFAATPEELPALTIRESELLRSEGVQEGDFYAGLVSPHPTMRGFSTADLPMLEGYVATTPRPQAETILTSPERDPILAAWQYGLGRAVVWTPDVGGPWTREWQGWPEAGPFWANLIRHVLPDPLVGPLALRVQLDGAIATIEAEALEPDGTPINRAGQPGGPTLRATIAATSATGTEPEQPLYLRQVAPGRYRTTVRLPGPGLYRVNATLQTERQTIEAATAIVQPYPAEYRPITPDTITTLKTLAQRTGGRLLDTPEAALPPPQPAAPPPLRLAPWLLVAALALWPLEIAIRRGWVARLLGWR